MRIGVVSDLHIDANLHMVPDQTRFIEGLNSIVTEKQIDVLLIAGDVSDDYRMTLDVLETLDHICPAQVLFVPGNHDYWSINHDVKDAWKIHQALSEWKGSLTERSYHLNDDWVVIGNTGWYDYSFGNPAFTEADFNDMHHMDRTWKDSKYVQWGMDNKAVHHYFMGKLENELKRHRGKNIIMMTHVVTHPEFIVPTPHPLWDYFNAFLGSSAYGKLYQDYNVRYGIMGHVHYRKTAKINNTHMICACLGKYTEWKRDDWYQELEASIYTFEID
ncbi:metallophosphoesterase [Lentibacillus saliphilus]|uniref:metallophosphoesterase n=1 Tax=Lentibacillus saliphilus TaxID=2737028 RepID=UPI001C30EA95|nr:metallophosphoesterase [Lentibacillus saliphilus]